MTTTAFWRWAGDWSKTSGQNVRTKRTKFGGKEPIDRKRGNFLATAGYVGGFVGTLEASIDWLP